MGTKRQLAPKIGSIIRDRSTGPFLDVFSGLGTVAGQLANDRAVWLNDVSAFGATVANALYVKNECEHCNFGDKIFYKNYETHCRRLKARFQRIYDLECYLLSEGNLEIIEALQSEMPYYKANNELHDSWLNKYDYNLFSIGYSGTYFSLSQCIQIDSIRYAIDKCIRRCVGCSTCLSQYLTALCVAASKTSNSTGHFAQYLTPNSRNARRVISQWRRDVLSSFEVALAELRGGSPVFKENKVFCAEANELLSNFRALGQSPGAIYADPPYTSDHYSRYYHVFETIIKYDYPNLSGKGRYREGRFSSDFSIKTKAEVALSNLVSNAAALGSTFFLSYPSNGVIPGGIEKCIALVSQVFARTEVFTFDYAHSTMGASKGSSRNTVQENLLIGRL
ncbi:MAG: DNA adenine methylase [Hoeflea sp.]|uniref:DNA adenine methylase n=1 Tax=Hoeflea sp. TaxID=1940281 RepID=UPI0032F0789E